VDTSFVDSAELYDAIYHFKNYARESETLRTIIKDFVRDARTILDVACGTGNHHRFLKEHFSVDGFDINPDYLRVARTKNPAGNYSLGDMTDFDLGRTYDAVTCLFSAIGNVKTVAPLEAAIASMARHVRSGGVLIVEPWFTPETWHPGSQFIHAGEIPTGTGADKVCRLSISGQEGNLSTLLFHYLRGSRDGIEHYSEVMKLGLFTRDQMTHAFESVGMKVAYDPAGLMDRGLYIARKS
jgi:SAM-dependent methyltransferase